MPGSTFTIGKGNVLRDGTDITLIANGIMVTEALAADRELQQQGSVPPLSTCSPSNLQEEYGLTAAAIVAAARELLWRALR